MRAALFVALLMVAIAIPARADLPQVDETGTIPCCPSPFFLGPRWADGHGTQAAFDAPSAIAYDSHDGAFYITDSGSQTIRRYGSDGKVTTLAGACDRELFMARCAGRELDGEGETARFDGPALIAYEPRAHGLLVYDAGSSALRFVGENGIVETLGRIANLTGLAVDSKTGRWYGALERSVVDLTLNGDIFPIPLWAATNPAELRHAPAYDVNDVTVDPQSGDLFATVYASIIVRIDRARSFKGSTLAGDPKAGFALDGYVGVDGVGPSAKFQGLERIVFDPIRQRLVVSEYSTIRSVSLGGVVTTLVPRTATRRRRSWINGIAVNGRDGTIAFLDGSFLRMLSPDGKLRTVAGNGKPPAIMPSRWNARYLNTDSGETLDVFVDGDSEIEIFRNAQGKIYDARRGSRSAALDVAQFWTSDNYVRVGSAQGTGSFEDAVASLSCGPLADKSSDNPIHGYPIDRGSEKLFFVWYGNFARSQTPRYSLSSRCAAVQVTNAKGDETYADYESRAIPHAVPYGLTEYTDERVPLPEP